VSVSECNLLFVVFKSIAVALPSALVFIAGLWIYFRRLWGPADQVIPDPRLSDENLHEEWRESQRRHYSELSLSERNAEDRRNAAATVKRWRKKGLP